jgi:methyl-accepting chemotaxis protein
VRLVAETGKALDRIVEQVGRLNSLIVDIAGSAQEQATGLAEVNTAVNQMDRVTQQNAAMVEEATAASHGLAKEAEDLGQLVEQFRIDMAGGSHTGAGPTRRSAPPSKAPPPKPNTGMGKGSQQPITSPAPVPAETAAG